MSKQITTVLPDAVFDRLQEVRKKHGIPIAQQIQRALPLYWKQLEG